MRALVLAWQEETGGVGGFSGAHDGKGRAGVSPLVSSYHLWGVFGVGENSRHRLTDWGSLSVWLTASTRSSALRSYRPVRLKETANARNFPY